MCRLQRDVEIVNPLESETLLGGGTPLVSTTYVATSRDRILRYWELGAISRIPDLP
jgi:hypothetical protein